MDASTLGSVVGMVFFAASVVAVGAAAFAVGTHVHGHKPQTKTALLVALVFAVPAVGAAAVIVAQFAAI